MQSAQRWLTSKIFALALLPAAALCSMDAPAMADGSGASMDGPFADGWALTLYGAIGTDGGIEDFPGFQADFNDAYMAAAALSRELYQWRNLAALEVEGQVAQHFGMQGHAEANFLLVGRWQAFPWNSVARTSVAVGEGISYASSVPQIERERSPNKTSRLLNYLMIELEVAPPDEEHWSFVTRIHHRSGVFGLYDGVSRGSNLLGAGLKYRF